MNFEETGSEVKRGRKPATSVMKKEPKVITMVKYSTNPPNKENNYKRETWVSKSVRCLDIAEEAWRAKGYERGPES